MKILIISAEFPPFFVGGISIHTFETCKYLIRENNDVHVVSFKQTSNGDEFEKECLEGINIYRVKIPTGENNYQTNYELQNIKIKMGILKLKKLENDFDLIVVHGYFLGEAAIFAKDLFETPLIYHAHTDYDLNVSLIERASKSNSKSYLNERLLVNESQHIIAVTHYLKNLLINNFGNEEKISIISKGLHLDLFEKALQNKKTAENKFYTILYVGRISEDKGIEVALDAIYNLKKSQNNIRLNIIGTSISEQYLLSIKNKIKELNILENVAFLGYKNTTEIIDYYINSYIVIVPSYSETFGKVIIEAMAAGVPTAVSDCSGMSELIIHEKNGLKFKAGDSNELSSCMLKLINDNDLYEEISQNGINEAFAKYDIGKVCQRTYGIYLDSIR